MTLKRFAPLALALCLPAITLNALAGTDERQSSAAAPEAAAPADTPPASATASAKQPEAIPPLPRDVFMDLLQEGRMPGGWTGLGSVSLAVSTGSSDSTSSLINLDLSRKLAHSKTGLLGSLNYATAIVDGKRQTSARKWAMSVQQDRDISADWFAFAKAALDGDKSLELSRRTKLSSGLGYHLVAEKHATVDVFGGLSYSDRRYSTPQTLHGHTSDHFQRPGGIFGEETSHQLSETVTIKQRLEAYPDFSAMAGHSATFTSSVGVSMTRKLSLSVTLTANFNQYVPAGVARLDTSLFTGLSLKLGD